MGIRDKRVSKPTTASWGQNVQDYSKHEIDYSKERTL